MGFTTEHAEVAEKIKVMTGKRSRKINSINWLTVETLLFNLCVLHVLCGKLLLMKLVVIGSGTSTPHPERSSSGYWVETKNGSVMLDFSASAVHRLAQEQLDWANLDAVWISHFHLDHVGGLAPFLFGMKHADAAAQRNKPLRIFGAEGINNLLETYHSAYVSGFLEQRFPLEIIEVAAGEKFRLLNDLEAVTLSTPHTEESHAIQLMDGDGKTLVYTADTGFTNEVSSFAHKVDLLLMECSFVRDKKAKLHLELSEALYLAKQSKARKTMLTHFYPEWDDIDFEAEVEKISPETNVVAARDGFRLQI